MKTVCENIKKKLCIKIERTFPSNTLSVQKGCNLTSNHYLNVSVWRYMPSIESNSLHTFRNQSITDQSITRYWFCYWLESMNINKKSISNQNCQLIRASMVVNVSLLKKQTNCIIIKKIYSFKFDRSCYYDEVSLFFKWCTLTA